MRDYFLCVSRRNRHRGVGRTRHADADGPESALRLDRVPQPGRAQGTQGQTEGGDSFGRGVEGEG